MPTVNVQVGGPLSPTLEVNSIDSEGLGAIPALAIPSPAAPSGPGRGHNDGGDDSGLGGAHLNEDDNGIYADDAEGESTTLPSSPVAPSNPPAPLSAPTRSTSGGGGPSSSSHYNELQGLIEEGEDESAEEDDDEDLGVTGLPPSKKARAAAQAKAAAGSPTAVLAPEPAAAGAQQLNKPTSEEGIDDFVKEDEADGDDEGSSSLHLPPATSGPASDSGQSAATTSTRPKGASPSSSGLPPAAPSSGSASAPTISTAVGADGVTAGSMTGSASSRRGSSNNLLPPAEAGGVGAGLSVPARRESKSSSRRPSESKINVNEVTAPAAPAGASGEPASTTAGQ
jgi:hypothetical protein